MTGLSQGRKLKKHPRWFPGTDLGENWKIDVYKFSKNPRISWSFDEIVEIAENVELTGWNLVELSRIGHERFWSKEIYIQQVPQ